MQAYWNMLEWKRKQLEKEEKEQMVGQVVSLPQSIKYIQLDLRDLMSQVSNQVSTAFLLKSTHVLFSLETLEEVTPRSDKKLFCFLLQLSYMQRSLMTPTSAPVRPASNPETGSKTVWDSRVEGYIILRDLDLYLTKLARDFLLLASKNVHESAAGA